MEREGEAKRPDNETSTKASAAAVAAWPYELRRPIPGPGKALITHVNEPAALLGRHLRIMGGGKSDEEKMVRLCAAVMEIPPSFADELDARDVMALAGLLAPLLGGSSVSSGES